MPSFCPATCGGAIQRDAEEGGRHRPVGVGGAQLSLCLWDLQEDTIQRSGGFRGKTRNLSFLKVQSGAPSRRNPTPWEPVKSRKTQPCPSEHCPGALMALWNLAGLAGWG